MVGTKIILSILGVGVTCAGGYFIIDKITRTKWITLAKSNEEAYRGRENGSKFGTKFRDWMVSTTREKNKGFWEGRIRIIADLNENNSLKTDGYLAGVAEKAVAWKSADETNKEDKMNGAIEKLKNMCRDKYDDTAHKYPKEDKDRWDEIWRYCSVSVSNRMKFTPS